MNAPRFLFSLTALFLAVTLNLSPEEFTYRHQKGSKYRILSVVNEDVYINRRFSHRAKILNRVAVETGEVTGDSAVLSAVFQTSEQAEGGGKSFQWASEYDSVFSRDSLGRMTIDSKYFMPVVRNVPVFPGRDLKEGETWSAEGHEMHDFRKVFGIEDPYRIPFTADYSYLGKRSWGDKEYPAFSVSYRIFYEPPAVKGKIWPRRIMGASDQVVYWDVEMGQSAAYEENFRMIFEMSDGQTIEYRGKADAKIIESQIMNKEDMAKDIDNTIKDLDIGGASVRVDDGGVTISLENIQFRAESSELLPSETEKLDKIGEILKKFPDRDIQVGGHTAMAGTAAGRAKLSRERAAAVAEYLIGKGIRSPSQVVVRGFGAEKPLGDNSTEEGKKKNRRVEITILEN